MTDLIVTNGTALTHYDAMRRAIDHCYQHDELTGIRDNAKKLEAAARVAKDQEAELICRKIRFRAEHQLGELLTKQKETVGLNTGGKPTGPAGELPDPRPTYKEIGISSQDASDYRRLADNYSKDELEEIFEENPKTTMKQLVRRKKPDEPVPVGLQALGERATKDILKAGELKTKLQLAEVESGKSLNALMAAFLQQEGEDEASWWEWFEGRFPIETRSAKKRMKEV